MTRTRDRVAILFALALVAAVTIPLVTTVDPVASAPTNHGDEGADCSAGGPGYPAVYPGADLQYCHFTGIDLGGEDFTETDLTGTIFDNTTGADLPFTRALMTDVLFFNADHPGASFVDADLTDAVFEFSGRDDMTFDDATMVGVGFTHANFTNSSFVGTDLSDSVFSSSIWDTVDLTDADLSGVRFGRSGFPSGTFAPYDLDNATFTRTNLTDADLFGVDLRDAVDLASAVYSNTTCPNGSLATSNTGCSDNTPGDDELAGMGTDCLAQSPPVAQKGGQYFNCRILENDFFTGQDLRGAYFAGALVDVPDLTGANLNGADFDVITASGVEFFTYSNTICPDGSNSDRNGGTCVGHLEPAVNFAVIGDYGSPPKHAQVIGQVNSTDPDFVVTTGDNIYLSPPTKAKFNKTVGDFYRDEYLDTGNFYPAMGNHDAKRVRVDSNGDPDNGFGPATFAYRNFFGIDAQNASGLDDTYYDVRRGDVHLFVVDNERLLRDDKLLCADDEVGISHYCPSDRRITTMADALSGPQDDWLQTELAASTAVWKLVFMHHAPYSNATEHGDQPLVQWPYAAWGADAVLAGHDHVYERLFVDGIPYFVVGTSGGSLRCNDVVNNPPFSSNPPARSRSHDTCVYGSMDVFAGGNQITFRYQNVDGSYIDECQILRDGSASPDPCSGGSPPPGGFAAFNDLAWGHAEPGTDEGLVQASANITMLTATDTEAGSSTGELVDRVTGSDTDVTLSIVGGRFGPLSQAADHTGAAPPGSDADAIFGGALDTLGSISGTGDSSPDGDTVLTFSGLEPTQRYSVALFGHRDDFGWDQAMLVTLEDALSFTNASSTGVDDTGAPLFSSDDDPSTRLPADNAAGWVARFMDINPGADGAIALRAAPDGTTPTEAPFLNAVMIATDDTVPPEFSIADAEIVEHDAGVRSLGFLVTLSEPLAETATVLARTTDGTATSPSDFTRRPAARITFNAGVTTRRVWIRVNGDTAVEPDETFTVTLYDPSHGGLGDAVAVGTIRNND